MAGTLRIYYGRDIKDILWSGHSECNGPVSIIVGASALEAGGHEHTKDLAKVTVATTSIGGLNSRTFRAWSVTKKGKVFL